MQLMFNKMLLSCFFLGFCGSKLNRFVFITVDKTKVIKLLGN